MVYDPAMVAAIVSTLLINARTNNGLVGREFESQLGSLIMLAKKYFPIHQQPILELVGISTSRKVTFPPAYRFPAKCNCIVNGYLSSNFCYIICELVSKLGKSGCFSICFGPNGILVS